MSLPLHVGLLASANEVGPALVGVPVARTKIVLDGSEGAQSPLTIKLPHVEHLVIARIAGDHLLVTTTGAHTTAMHNVRHIVLIDFTRSTAVPVVLVTVGGVVVARTTIVEAVVARPL